MTETPSRTPTGRPWVRWQRNGDTAGWFALGSREPEALRAPFWQALVAVAARLAGVRLDQAHAMGPGILSIGALSLTASSGAAQKLLHLCLLREPARFLEVMAPVIHATGAFTRETSRSPSGAAFSFEDGHLLLGEPEIRQLVTLGSDAVRWTSPQKQRAQLWVSSCSELLRDQRMDRAQAEYAMEELPKLLSEEVRALVRWPARGLEDAWQYTREQLSVWAFVLLGTLSSPADVAFLLGCPGPRGALEQGSASDALREIINVVSSDPSEPFAALSRTLEAVLEWRS